MKQPISVFVAIVSAILIGNTPAKAEIRIGIESASYPPFYTKTPSGGYEGWEFEIGEALCAAMKEECEWVPVSWDGIIPALLAKNFDAVISSMSITEERMKTIGFSARYYQTPAVIVAPKGSDIDGSPEHMEGKILGAQVSSPHANYAKKYFDDSAASIKIYQDLNEQNQDLYAGRVDAVLADGLAMQPFLTSSGGQCCEVKANPKDESIFGPGVGVGLRKEDEDLRARFNAAIDQILHDGTYQKISSRYFTFDIYGGDQ